MLRETSTTAGAVRVRLRSGSSGGRAINDPARTFQQAASTEEASVRNRRFLKDASSERAARPEREPLGAREKFEFRLERGGLFRARGAVGVQPPGRPGIPSRSGDWIPTAAQFAACESAPFHRSSIYKQAPGRQANSTCTAGPTTTPSPAPTARAALDREPQCHAIN